MRLLLDEMLSPQIARQLRDRGFDVEAIKRDRPELESQTDGEIVRRMAEEKRAVVTNDIADFQPLHDRILSSGEEHYGMVFSFDDTMPRTKAAIPRWVDVLEELMSSHPQDDAFHNRVHHLP